MLKTRGELICEALDAAVALGIKIWPGAAFDWTDRPDCVTFRKFKVPGPSGLLPSTCNAIGAMELLLGRQRKFEPGFTIKICNYLKVDGHWLYKFHIGFDRGIQLYFRVENKKKKGKFFKKEDKVSKLGLRLRGRYVGK